MDKLIKFLDFSCIDPRLYWQVPSRDTLVTFEVQWRRDEKFRWRFRQLGALLWEIGRDDSLEIQLADAGVDTEQFTVRLKASMLQQVVFAHRVVEDARRTFGAPEVDKALADHQDFMQALEQAIQALAQPSKPQRPELRILKNTQST